MTTIGSFEQFFREEYASVVAVAAWLTGSRAVAEDLAQEAFSTAHRNWSTVADYERPGAFVRRVAVNLASNERRRRGREHRALQRLPEPAVATPPDDGPDERLWRAVGALPMQQRAAVALRYQDELTTAEIADLLACAESTVRVHLHRAHRRLAEQLGLSGPDEQPHSEQPAEEAP